MNKKMLIGFSVFIVVMIVDKLIVPIPDWLAVILEAASVVLIVTGAIQAKKTGVSFGADHGSTVPFDPEKQEAVIRCSVCNDEKTAGFKDKETGHFTEVMLIKTPADEERFKETYGLDDVKKEY